MKKHERHVKYKKLRSLMTEARRTGGLFKAAGGGEVYLSSEMKALKVTGAAQVIQNSVRAEAISGTG